MGPAGTERKLKIIRQAEQWARYAQAGKTAKIAGKKVAEAILYPTGKYDNSLYPQAPDQGIEFICEDKSSLIIRPSGTGNNLRFYTFSQSPWSQAKKMGVPSYLAQTNKAAYDFAFAAQRQIQEEIGLKGKEIE